MSVKQETDIDAYITNLLSIGEIQTYNLDSRLPQELITLYKKMWNNLNGLRLGRWNILSICEAEIYNSELHKHGEMSIYNFATVYHGLGWIIVAAIDLTNSMVFLRMDGGSSFHDVKINLDKTLAYRKKSASLKSKLLTFKQFIDLCILEETSSYTNIISDSYYIH